MANSLKDKVQEVTGKEKFQKAAYGLMDDLDEMRSATKEMASDSIHEIQEERGRLYERGQEKIEGLELRLESGIKKYPLRALVLAAGVGFLVGWLRRRRKS